jgi:hypothetical protein
VGEAPKARSGFARQVRLETKKVLVQGQEGSGMRVVLWLLEFYFPNQRFEF